MTQKKWRFGCTQSRKTARGSENRMGESYVPLRALTLATRSWNPWPHKLGTSSSTISIFLPSNPGLSYSWSL